jgi:transglutaminase-like putative cysteine protease
MAGRGADVVQDATGPLAATWFVDADDPAVQDFAHGVTHGTTTRAEAASALFAAVRDRLWYDPYQLDLRPEAMRASAILDGGPTWCVPKAVLLTATCRAVGIPARLGFADVRNHLSSPRLAEAMGTDVFRFHGYTHLEVEAGWFKVTPAFNAELCERFGVAPLTFDGDADALLHAHDGAGRRHMEYLVDHGTFDDLPLDRIVAVFEEEYAGMLDRVDGVDPAFSPAGKGTASG